MEERGGQPAPNSQHWPLYVHVLSTHDDDDTLALTTPHNQLLRFLLVYKHSIQHMQCQASNESTLDAVNVHVYVCVEWLTAGRTANGAPPPMSGRLSVQPTKVQTWFQPTPGPGQAGPGQARPTPGIGGSAGVSWSEALLVVQPG